jgi:predicted RNA-binding Zn ribbon-like protein
MAGKGGSVVGRFGLEPAPAGLRLAQDLVNTTLSARQGTENDHLADLESANAWLRESLAAWSAASGRKAPELVLRKRDLAPLRALREQFRQGLRANAAHVDPVEPAEPGDVVSAGVRLSLHANGHVGHRPLDDGWLGVAGLLSIELLLADATGTLSRLKTCAAPVCGACFYDGSPNRARVWHNTKMCGNVPNLRASRARRKTLDQHEGTTG